MTGLCIPFVGYCTKSFYKYELQTVRIVEVRAFSYATLGLYSYQVVLSKRQWWFLSKHFAKSSDTCMVL